MPRLEALLIGILALILGRYGALADSAQYCHLQTTEVEAIPFCVAVSKWENPTTRANDLVVTFGYRRTYDRGWAAIGLGESMVPSLIFMTYGLQAPGEDLIISVRDGREYSEPRPAPGLPKVEQLRVSWTNSTRWLETSFLCSGCEDWAAKRRASSTLQPWIWAFNEQDEVENATVESSVWFHSYTGYFQLDMAGSDATAVSGMPAIPFIDQEHPNSTHTTSGNSNVGTYSNLVLVHGGFLALAMIVLYPCGVILVRSMPSKTRLYLFFQIAASVFCAIGAAAMIYALTLTGWVAMLSKPHAVIGMMVLLLIIPQLSLGYIRHRIPSTSPRSAMIGKAHVWIGRSILFGGCLNTIFGLQFAGFSTGVLLLASAVVAFDFAMIAFLPRILRGKRDDLGNRNAGDEDAVPLLEEGLELK